MKSTVKTGSLKFIFTLLVLFISSDFYGQFQRGNNQNAFGRQSAIPRTQEPQEKEDPKTATEIVDEQMPSITKALELNGFQTAVMSSILKKYLQERIELQILKLTPDDMREAFLKIDERQTEELQAGLPPEKYDAFLDLQKDGITKTLKKKKKKQKKDKN